MNETMTWVGVAASAVSGVVAVVTLYLRSRAKVQLAAIDNGTPEAARVIADAVTSFGIDTKGLTKQQLYQLAREEIANRDRRHARTLWGSLLLSVVLAATVVILAWSAREQPAPASQDSHQGSVHVNTNAGSMTINMPGSPTPVPSE